MANAPPTVAGLIKDQLQPANVRRGTGALLRPFFLMKKRSGQISYVGFVAEARLSPIGFSS